MIASTTLPVAAVVLAGLANAAVVPRYSSGSSSNNNAATYLAQAQANVGTLPSGWSAVGCYTDSGRTSTLSGASTSSWTMSYETCTSYCSAQGYNYAGVEDYWYCYCGNSISSSSSIEAYSNCQDTCPGSWGQDCGGSDDINIFYNSGAVASASAAAASSTSAAAASSSKAAAASSSSAAAASSSAAAAASSSSSAAAASSSSAAAASSSKAAAASASSASAAQASASSASAAASASSASAASASASASAASASASAAAASSSKAAAASASSASAAAASASASSASAAAASVSAAAASASSASAASASASIASVAAAASSAASASVAAASASAASVAAAASSSSAAAASSASAAAAQASASVASVSAAAASASSAVAASASASLASVSAAAASASAAAASSVSAAAASASASVASASAAVASSASAASASVSAAAASASAAAASSVSAAAASASASVASASASAASSASAAAASASAAVAALALPTGWTASVCIAEVSGRALTGSSFTASNMTQTMCASYCEAKGYTIAGIEYASECYCGDLLTDGASLTKTSTACTMSCAGDSTHICGGSNAITLIVSDTAVAELSADLTSKVVTLPTGWSVATSACVAEGTSGRALASASTSSSSMTIGTCISYCAGKGFQYAGLEYGSECYCGDALVNGASLSLPSTTCTMICSGDASEICGGSNGLQLYNNPSLALDLITANGYALQGCIQEVSGRALTGASTASDSLTIETCTAFCAASGFTYAGIEYGRECYCGNSLDNGASTSSLSTQCTMSCAGSSSELCGGPNAIQLYMA